MIKNSTLCLIVWALLISLLAGCGLFRSEPKTTPAPSPPGQTASPSTPGPPEGTLAPLASPETQPTTLVMWTSEDYAPTSETSGGAHLLDQIQTFQQDHGVQVQVILKKRSGSGGLLDFLTTASKAAPSVLPDLITLSEADLFRAAQAGLLQPLDDLVSPTLLADQFDFAHQLTQVDGATMGVLYQADLSHLVYDTITVKDLPLNWQTLYSSTVPLVFSPFPPTDGVNDVILSQYLALGGRLTDAANLPVLDAEPLAQTLTLFQQALEAQVMPSSVLDLTDATTAWAEWRIGESGMAIVPASLYLAERAGLSNIGFGAVPFSTSEATSIGYGWALAIVTTDPTRQTTAAALIEHLLSPENQGAWSQAAGRLPTRRAALNVWDTNDPYVPFIRSQLLQAQAAPNPDLATVLGGPLSDALADVLRGRNTPEQAAQSAVETVESSQ